MFYIWLSIVVLLAIIEILTGNLVSIWFVISGILSMITSLFITNVTIQITIFVIFGVLFMLLTKNTVKKIVPKKEKTNLDRVVGMEGIVTKKITKNTSGEVKVDGKYWTATADKTILPDTIVKVLALNSTKLKVEIVKE